jgi:hypothetical protein
MDSERFQSARRFQYRRVVVVILALVVSFLSYPIGDGSWISGVPLPVVAFEPSADKTSFLPFSSPFSLIFLFANMVICTCVAIAFDKLVVLRLYQWWRRK